MKRFGTGPQASRPERAAAAIQITQHIHDFKLCEGCGSIVARACVVCPRCHAYRHNEEPESVRRAALALGRRKPEPLTFHPLDDTEED
jgi:uncharacterized paraquat-inducible protein A